MSTGDIIAWWVVGVTALVDGIVFGVGFWLWKNDPLVIRLEQLRAKIAYDTWKKERNR